MMIEILINGIVGVVSAIVAWFLARKKYNAEVDNNLIENMQKSLEFYMKLSDDNKTRLDEALQKNQKLEDEIYQLRQQVSELMMTICYDMSCELRKRSVKKTKTKKDGSKDCSQEAIQEG